VCLRFLQERGWGFHPINGRRGGGRVGDMMMMLAVLGTGLVLLGALAMSGRRATPMEPPERPRVNFGKFLGG